MSEIIILVSIALLIVINLVNLFSGREASARSVQSKLEMFENRLAEYGKSLREEFAANRKEYGVNFQEFRRELGEQFTRFTNLIQQKVDGLQSFSVKDAREGRTELSSTLKHFEEKITSNLELIRKSVDNGLSSMQRDNNEKLEQMRKTVDEKLHSTLEKRLGESFKLVSDRLESVQKGLGEMQTLATGVGDLKKVLSNVKSRGVIGEYQLAAILEQLMTPQQYSKNVMTKPGSRENVEFAVKIPDKTGANDFIWLPIDSKFPTENYQRLLSAYEAGDRALIDESVKLLSANIEKSARDIRDKYIEPPHTTDFAVMFLPFEGLYAEVLRIPGLFEKLQNVYRVTVTGPTTVSALINSLQMGFRTLAIEKRTGEVWQVLGAVKTEFGKFGDILDQTRKKLDAARAELDKTGVRTRRITSRLREVETLPDESIAGVLAVSSASDPGEDETDD